MTTTGQHYGVIRAELTELADTLSEEQIATPVPALPGWSVRDTYAHLAGVAADIVRGQVGDPHDVGWTAGHVAARKDRSLAEICREWGVEGPRAEELLDAPELRRGCSRSSTCSTMGTTSGGRWGGARRATRRRRCSWRG
ncbi:maleylpyruvate isomerase N-terminal domain-containing protein [Catenulispora yoronensis]